MMYTSVSQSVMLRYGVKTAQPIVDFCQRLLPINLVISELNAVAKFRSDGIK